MTSLTSRISSDVSGCCDSFCDNGPRFLISNIVSVLIQIAFVITILIIEIGPWSWWYSAFLVLGAAVNLLVLKSSWRNTRKCGDLFGFTACLHYGHFWSAGLLRSLTYTGGKYKLNTSLPSAGFLLCAVVMTLLAFWHKKEIVPRDPCDPSHVDNRTHPKLFKIWQYSLGPMAAFVYGMAESRFGTGKVPAPHSSESLIGVCTAFLMFSFYYRKYRTSAWGSLISLIWEGALVLLMVVASVLCAVKPQNYNERIQYRISLVICFIYLLFFTLAFSSKFCLLKEPLHLNFSSVPIGTSKSTTTVFSPSANTFNLEAQPYGVSRPEAEAAARKLGFNDSTDDYLERSKTEMTDTSIKGH